MDDWGLAVVLTIVGAFLGTIISPASKLAFASLLARDDERFSYSIGGGLALLSAANALWVLSFILFETAENSPWALVEVLILYFGAAVLLLASFSQFRRCSDGAVEANVLCVVSILVLGNLAWLLGESSEVGLRIFGLDSFPHLVVKYCFFVAAAAFFAAAVVKAVMRRVVPAEQSAAADCEDATKEPHR